MQLGSIIKFAYKIGELILNFKTSQSTHFAFVRGKRRNVIMQFRYLSNLFWFFTLTFFLNRHHNFRYIFLNPLSLSWKKIYWTFLTRTCSLLHWYYFKNVYGTRNIGLRRAGKETWTWFVDDVVIFKWRTFYEKEYRFHQILLLNRC